jgi:hypothetical protein
MPNAAAVGQTTDALDELHPGRAPPPGIVTTTARRPCAWVVQAAQSVGLTLGEIREILAVRDRVNGRTPMSRG